MYDYKEFQSIIESEAPKMHNAIDLLLGNLRATETETFGDWKMPLTCPVGEHPMQNPVYGTNCSHPQVILSRCFRTCI